MKKILKYNFIDEIGGGGNGEVHKVICKDNDKTFALKKLHDRKKKQKESTQRFLDEIKIMKDNFEKVVGIMPIFDFCESEYWYVMPIATPIMTYIKDNNLQIEEIINGIIQLCETLECLHDRHISHRDIKPSNIFYYEDRFYLGDFGIADFEEKEHHFTRFDRGLGAIFTIAPEMKRNPKNSDGCKADVFSLSKTTWMLLTKDDRGFDGVYNILDKKISLRYLDYYKSTHLVELEEILVKATDNDPDLRPTVKEFKEALIEWKKIYNDFSKSQVSSWNFLNKILFGPNFPESAAWSDRINIVEVLNIVGSIYAYNHMLFSDKGGLDFDYAEIAAEEGCIRLYDSSGFCFITKPKKLYFRGFGTQYQWNYFLLELDNLLPVLEINKDKCYEYLVEDFPGNYVSAECAVYGVYDYDKGNRLPNDFKVVERYLKGKFLITMKIGPYNSITATYDGRHGDCSATEFENYIEFLMGFYLMLYKKIKGSRTDKNITEEVIQRQILSSDIFKINPFKKDNNKINNEIVTDKSHKEEQKKFLKENLYKLDFSDLTGKYYIDNKNIKFRFKLSLSDDFSLADLEQKYYYITINGTVKEMPTESTKECFYIGNRSDAIKFKENINLHISKYLEENNHKPLEPSESLIIIELEREGIPKHLFKKEEIKEAMNKADDRNNNQLVIDEDGYVKIIQKLEEGFLYPVRHEVWISGNNYVGKYSKLSSLDDDYISSLQGWLLYLQTGEKQYIDYISENQNEDLLLEEIRKFYI